MDKNKLNLCIEKYLGIGRDNAMHARDLCAVTGLGGRELRKVIRDARISGAMILSDQSGYFIPDLTTEAGVNELRDFIHQQNAHALSRFGFLNHMEKTLDIAESKIKGQKAFDQDCEVV